LETSIEGARGVLFNITGGPDLGMLEVNAAAELVQKSADPDANIIVGAVIDENLKDEILITVIATGFEKGPIVKRVIDNQGAGISGKNMGSGSSPVSSPASSISSGNEKDDFIDIPTFLRRNKFR
jgi:cell division protein FtsZ